MLLQEPELMFQHEQGLQDPRDGLVLFGPLDSGKPYGIRWGVIGTRTGIRKIRNWVGQIQSIIANEKQDIARPAFPGFEAVFRVPWNREPLIEKEIDENEIKSQCFLDDKYQRVYNTVGIFAQKIKDALREEEAHPDIWFIIIPDYVYKYCRPESIVESNISIKSEYKMRPSYARSLRDTSSMFNDDNVAAIPYEFEVHFHNQVKARLLEDRVPTQVIRESTIAPEEFVNQRGQPIRDLEKLKTAIAWNICTTIFYKAGGRPWKLASVRERVCYVGIVFKKEERSNNPRNACCAAQMFLDSGDGVVFKGAVGPWYNPEKGTFHLKSQQAKELVKMAINSYYDKMGVPPAELFLHGKIAFNEEEWEGFKSGVDGNTKIVGVRIRNSGKIRLYRKGCYPILRGLAYLQDKQSAFLWTRGYVPRLQTSMSLEVPCPLEIIICRGEADLKTVLGDIMDLTKLNYNACIFADGQPITLKFANAVGEILTAGPIDQVPPLPFKYYI